MFNDTSAATSDNLQKRILSYSAPKKNLKSWLSVHKSFPQILPTFGAEEFEHEIESISYEREYLISSNIMPLIYRSDYEYLEGDEAESISNEERHGFRAVHARRLGFTSWLSDYI